MDWQEEAMCPCCGAERQDEGWLGLLPVCTVCGWVPDPACDEETPSAENDGLSLAEARMNFQTFGSIVLPVDCEE